MFSYSEVGLERLRQLAAWLIADILTLPNLVQIPAVALTGVVAWLVSRPLRSRLCDWVVAVSAEHPRDWVARHQSWIIDRLVPLITPVLWVAGLWISLGVARHFGWPSDVARIAANLLLAWLVIRLAADLVPYPTLARLIAVAAWSLAALSVLNLLGPLAEFLDSAALTVGRFRLSILTVVKGVLFLVVLLWVSIFLSRLFERRITQLSDLTPRAQVLVGKLLRITLVTLAVVLALTSVGVDLSTLALLTGAIGVGIGLGLQKTVSNVFSGIVLLLDKSIKPGDVIQVGGTYGWVSALGTRYVAVETRDGTEYLIPNEDIITQQVLNWSHKSTRVRLKAPVRAALDADVEKVLALMKEAASRPPRILKHPPPNPVILRFGESAIELELRFWIADAHNGVHNVMSEVLLEIWRLFREHGVPMPYPKHDVVVHSAQRGESAPALDPPDLLADRAVGRRRA
ncbi:MAG: mechanosensitive ion channel [Pseudomonadota bacterium]|nr:mechanosensitive ion channel [Pseudomonadota bacterium]